MLQWHRKFHNNVRLKNVGFGVGNTKTVTVKKIQIKNKSKYGIISGCWLIRSREFSVKCTSFLYVFDKLLSIKNY